MANKTFTGTGTFATAARWDGSALPSAGDNLSIQGACTLDANETNVYGTITITAGNSLNLATYNLSGTTFTNAAGTLTIGTSAGTGLTCTSFIGTGATAFDFQTDSKIYCGGNVSIEDVGSPWVNNDRGELYLTGSGNYDHNDASSYWHAVTINAGVTTKIANTNCRFTAHYGTNDANHKFILNGTLDTGESADSDLAWIGLSQNGILTIGNSADIIGDGQITFQPKNSTLNYDGHELNTEAGCRFNFRPANTDNFAVYALNCPNTEIEITESTDPANIVFVGNSGDNTLYGTFFWCNNQPATSVLNFDNATNDIDFNFSDYISFNEGVNWTRGETEEWTLRGTSGTQNIEFHGETVGAIVLACAGATKTVSSNITCRQLSGTGGTLQSSVSGTQRTITVNNTGTTMLNCTIKDIALSSANAINAKSGCTNNGNNKGIVFTDTFGGF